MRLWPRLHIPTRIFLGFAVVIVAFSTLSISSVREHALTARSLRLLNEGYLPLAVTVGEAKATQAVFGTVVDRLMIARDSATRNWLDVGRKLRPVTLRRALLGVRRAERLGPESLDAALLKDVRLRLQATGTRFRRAEEHYQVIFRALDEGDDEAAKGALEGLRTQERAVDRSLRETRALLQERMASLSAEAASREQRSVALFGALALLALVVGFLVTVASQRVLSPLPKLQARVGLVAEGRLNEDRLSLPSDDELGRLATEFERMVDALIARDASLREAAEAQLRLRELQRQIVAALRAAVLVVDAGDTIRAANPAAVLVLRGRPDVVGMQVDEAGLLEQLPQLRDALNRVRNGELRVAYAAVPLQHPAKLDEGERFVDLVVTPLVEAGTQSTDASTESVLVVAEDVTRTVQTRARLIQSERLAAIGRMAAHVTHEVRNPLSSIGLNVELLREDLASGKVIEDRAEAVGLLQAIERQIESLRGITEDYLRLARMPEPHRSDEDLSLLAKSVGEFVELEMSSAQVVFSVDVAANDPVAHVDEAQLRQALMNLLRNAREAVGAGGRVRLSVTSDAGAVVVAVQDDGPGVSEKARAHLFDAFFTTKERGTGLGLPLTQQIVVANGGEIRCLKSDWGGARFEMRFPRVAEGVSSGAVPAISV